MSEKKILLVTGSNGLLGQSLIRRFSHEYNVMGCDISEENFMADIPDMKYDRLDLRLRESVQNYFNQNKPDIIINTAAFTDVDRSEEKRDECWAVNVKGVELILEAVRDFMPVLVQISTDYVFDGKRGKYRESDSANPISYYGRSKLAAEKIVRNSELNYIIARTQILYGWGRNVRNNFVTWVIEELKKKNNIRVVTDQRGNPTYVDDLSEAIYRLILNREFGLFHIAGDEVCSRFEFARIISDLFNLDHSLIQPISTSQLNQKAPRPMDSSFILDKLSNVLDWLPGDVKNALKAMKSAQA